jgi:hypothetical protein
VPISRTGDPWFATRSWMLTIGWRRHGLLSVHDLPATG